MKKKLQSVAIFKKTPIFVMRNAVLLTALLIKISFYDWAADMKKLRIDIQLLFHNVVYLTTIQNFLSTANWSGTLNHSTDLFSNEIAYTSYAFIKNKTQSFQLPK